MRHGPLVVVGDTLLDVDIDGVAGRLAPDAPVPVVDCQSRRHRPGGAGLAAVLASEMAEDGVVLVTAIAADRPGARLREMLGRHVEVVAMPLDGATSCKMRIRASGQPVARLDTGGGLAATGPLDARAERALRGAGAVLVADYGRGLARHPGLRALLTRAPAGVPVVWDPHPRGERPLPGTRLVTPSQAEARALAGSLGDGGPDPGAAGEGAHGAGEGAGGARTVVGLAARDAQALHRAWGAAVAVTLGQAGALLCTGGDVPFVAPAAPASAGATPDSCGAGDCFAAAAAQALRAGSLLTEAVVEAVGRASEFVRRGGAGAVPGLAAPSGLAGRDGAGGLDGRDGAGGPDGAGAPDGPCGPGGQRADADRRAWRVVADARARGGRIVATGGCFDLLHAGHVALLRQARSLGDCLVVCLNSDSSVQALKGPGRPLVCAEDRARVLSALSCVDAVITFAEPTPSAVLERLRPDVWAKGGDYASQELAEAAVVRRHGGEAVLLPYTARHSTSRIVAAARGLGGGAGPVALGGAAREDV